MLHLTTQDPELNYVYVHTYVSNKDDSENGASKFLSIPLSIVSCVLFTYCPAKQHHNVASVSLLMFTVMCPAHEWKVFSLVCHKVQVVSENNKGHLSLCGALFNTKYHAYVDKTIWTQGPLTLRLRLFCQLRFPKVKNLLWSSTCTPLNTNHRDRCITNLIDFIQTVHIQQAYLVKKTSKKDKNEYPHKYNMPLQNRVCVYLVGCICPVTKNPHSYSFWKLSTRQTHQSGITDTGRSQAAWRQLHRILLPS